MPWMLWRSWTALITHWVSLLKDTGALVVLGIGELTTTAKVLSEAAASFEQWATILIVAAGLYLVATLALIQFVPFVAGKLFKILQQHEGTGSQATERFA
jgi:ABC-type amino acid transport system permease subunit